MRSTLMVFIQNQIPRRPRHHSVSLANAPSSSLLATPAPAVAHAWYSFRGGVVCPGVPWRAAASSQAREGISSMATIPCACTSKHPRRPAQVQFHPVSVSHEQVSSLTLIRIARGARFGVIEVI